MHNRIIRAATLFCVALLIACNEDKPAETPGPTTPVFSFTKRASIERGNPYEKVVYLYNQAVKLNIVASADSSAQFDLNVIDKESYKNYVPGVELKYFYKMPDRGSIDTIIKFEKGAYIFSFENTKTAKPVQLNIKVEAVN